jgi:hypothetical protein
MKTETVNAIKTLTKKAAKAEKACDALQLSQAALNLAHTEATISSIKCKE